MRGLAKIVIIVAAALLLGVQFSMRWAPKGTGDHLRMEGAPAGAEGQPQNTQGGSTITSAAGLEQIAQELEKERLKLMEKEDLLSQREGRLLALQKEIEGKIAGMQALRNEMEKSVKQADEREEQKLNKLVKVYEGAPPEEAGRLLSMLDTDLAAKILFRMNDFKAGKLWAFVKPEKAVKISEKLTENINKKGAH